MRDCGRASRGRYIGGCRCDACRKANRDYERKTRLYGFESGFVDAEPVRERIGRLVGMGWTKREICRAADVPRSTMYALTRKHNRTGKPVAKVNAEVADRIMKLDKRRLKAGQLVSARRMRNVLLECSAAGISPADVSRATGIGYQTVYAVAKGTQSRIRVETLYAWVVKEPRVMEMIRREAVR